MGDRRATTWAGVLFAAIVLLGAPASRAQYVLEDASDPHRYDSNLLILPFVFYSPTYRFGGGVVLDSTGLLQPQSDTFGYALGSVNGTYALQIAEDDLQLRPFDRLFLDSQVGYYQDQDFSAYVNGNRNYPHQTAGSNHSSQRNFIRVRDVDAYGHLDFRYLLPIGGGRDTVINRYLIRSGELQQGATGGGGWDPLFTGRSYVLLSPFVEDQSLERPGPERHADENGLRFGYIYDNTDFPLNPGSGNLTRLVVSRDFGLFESSNAWTNVTAEFSQFIDLGRSPGFRQKVLALDAWSSYSITWDVTSVGRRRVVTRGPPFFDGAVLGGNERLRAFSENRFWDRAALYGAAELRLTPDWNPLREIELFKPADITWMQWVIFAEAGRVAGEYSPVLFNHLKGDVGFGLRLLANDTLIRFDVAASYEGFAVRAQLGQPF